MVLFVVGMLLLRRMAETAAANGGIGSSTMRRSGRAGISTNSHICNKNGVKVTKKMLANLNRGMLRYGGDNG